MHTAQRILITGTGSGFGRAATLLLLSSGHTVIATMRDIEGRNSVNVALVRRTSREFVGPIVCDGTRCH
ncbi:MAG: NAD(P)-dependent dehydrogenase (short-subunit alcohol dehydrogenase family) [Gammaproteobacteria bacterium]|jgi:NAD(P)-dependent dehydrogenase (short-subunit alcohol dehydrogenase family)